MKSNIFRPYKFDKERLKVAQKRIESVPDRGSDKEYANTLTEELAEGLKMKRSRAIPVAAIVLLCISLTICVVGLTLIGVFYITGVELMNIPTLFMVVLASLALFITSIYAIFDWKKWLGGWMHNV